MSRQERINTACALGIVAILLILLGGWLQSHQHVTSQSAPAAAVEVATDSDSEPSGIDGLTVGELLRDAWLSYETQLGTPSPAIGEEYNTTAEYSASYDGTQPAYPAEYFTIESNERPGLVHVFRMVASQRA